MPKVATRPLPLLLDGALKQSLAPAPEDPSTECAVPFAAAEDESSSGYTTADLPMMLGREAFQDAVTPLVPRLYRLCLALTGVADHAEDLLQSSLTKAYLRRRAFSGRGSLVGWLMAIVRSEHQETVRRVARRRSLLATARAYLDGLDDLFHGMRASTPPDPEDWVCTRQQADRLLACLQDLPERYRIIIWFCDVEELGYDEVSRMLDIPIGTVKSRHARGRTRLRRAIERRGGANG